MKTDSVGQVVQFSRTYLALLEPTARLLPLLLLFGLLRLDVQLLDLPLDPFDLMGPESIVLDTLDLGRAGGRLYRGLELGARRLKARLGLLACRGYM